VTDEEGAPLETEPPSYLSLLTLIQVQLPLTRAAVHSLGQAERAHQGESLVGRTEGTPPAGAAEDLTLAEAAKRHDEPGEQRTGDQHQMNDGYGDRNHGTADTGGERDPGSLEPVLRGKYPDIHLRRARSRACGSKGDLNRSDLHPRIIWEPIDSRQRQRSGSSSGYFRA
jgi:hypothetical protein